MQLFALVFMRKLILFADSLQLTTYNSEHIKTNDLCNFIVSRMEMGWPCYESGFHFMIGSGYSTLLLLLFIANEKDRKHSNFMPLSLIE